MIPGPLRRRQWKLSRQPRMKTCAIPDPLRARRGSEPGAFEQIGADAVNHVTTGGKCYRAHVSGQFGKKKSVLAGPPKIARKSNRPDVRRPIPDGGKANRRIFQNDFKKIVLEPIDIIVARQWRVAR